MPKHRIHINPISVPSSSPKKLFLQLSWILNLARHQPRGSFQHRMLLLMADAYEDRLFELGILVDAPDGGPVVSGEERLLLQQFDLS